MVKFALALFAAIWKICLLLVQGRSANSVRFIPLATLRFCNQKTKTKVLLNRLVFTTVTNVVLGVFSKVADSSQVENFVIGEQKTWKAANLSGEPQQPDEIEAFRN